MGHERIGFLPKTIEWRRLVADIATAAESPSAAPALAARTMDQVRRRFDSVQSDQGFQAAFAFLLSLTTYRLASTSGSPWYPDIPIEENPSALRLTVQLRSWVDNKAESLEYGELAKRAAADAILFWTDASSRQQQLFGSGISASEIWAGASNGAAFSTISRVFFAKFVERYLKYFLDREASAQLPTVEARNRFADSIRLHIDTLANHAFESSRISQSFAAGWFNKHARASRPAPQSVNAFLAVALGKLRQELQRESSE